MLKFLSHTWTISFLQQAIVSKFGHVWMIFRYTGQTLVTKDAVVCCPLMLVLVPPTNCLLCADFLHDSYMSLKQAISNQMRQAGMLALEEIAQGRLVQHPDSKVVQSATFRKSYLSSRGWGALSLLCLHTIYSQIFFPGYRSSHVSSAGYWLGQHHPIRAWWTTICRVWCEWSLDAEHAHFSWGIAHCKI